MAATGLRSIRFHLLSEAEQRRAGAAHPVAQVQLRSRHWRIFDAAGELVDEIQGEGVVGQHPTLIAGENSMPATSISPLAVHTTLC